MSHSSYNELATIVRTRRSIRGFKNTPLKQENLEEILRTAVWVPNHKNTQPWRFIISQSEPSRKKLAELFLHYYRQSSALTEDQAVSKSEKWFAAPTIVWTVMKVPSDQLQKEEDLAATCCVTYNIMLLAHSQGLGTFWRTVPEKENWLRNELGVAFDEKIVSCLFIGYPDNQNEIAIPRKQPLEPNLTIK